MPEFIEISDLFGETETVNPRHVQVRKDQIELVSFVMRAVQGRQRQIAHFQLPENGCTTEQKQEKHASGGNPRRRYTEGLSQRSGAQIHVPVSESTGCDPRKIMFPSCSTLHLYVRLPEQKVRQLGEA